MIRPATTSDAEAICELVNYYAERGRMLHRSLESIYDSLRDFVVCSDGEGVVGCVALSICWKDIAEIRSLAVAPHCQGQGVGRRLIEAACDVGKDLGLKRVFALTYEPTFFGRLGFVVVDREQLPAKVWRDCIHCPRADACDEVAMVRDL